VRLKGVYFGPVDLGTDGFRWTLVRLKASASIETRTHSPCFRWTLVRLKAPVALVDDGAHLGFRWTLVRLKGFPATRFPVDIHGFRWTLVRLKVDIVQSIQRLFEVSDGPSCG